MIRTVFTLIICGLASLLTAQNRFNLKGKIEGLKKDTIVYLVLNQNNDTIASALTKKGRFVFKGSLPTSIEWASVRIKGGDKWPTFFLENKKIGLKGAADSWPVATVIGSSETDNNRALRKSIGLLQDAYNATIMEKGKVMKAKDSLKIATLSTREKEITDSFLIVKEKFIREHEHAAYTAWLIEHALEFDLQRKREEYDKLTESARKSKFGLDLQKHIKELALREKIKQGASIPVFNVKTVSDEEISFPSVVSSHKLTLIDFWASWCKPCKEVLPDVERTYHAFKDQGFTVVSISTDKNKESWLKALKRDNTPWMNTRYIEDKEDPSDIFDLQSIPAFALIDQKGKLIAFYCQGSSIPGFGFKNGLNDSQDIYDTVREILIGNNED